MSFSLIVGVCGDVSLFSFFTGGSVTTVTGWLLLDAFEVSSSGTFASRFKTWPKHKQTIRL